MCLVAVSPVYDELGQERACEFRIDMGHAQNIVHVLCRLPVAVDPRWLGAVLQAGRVARPLDADMLDKFRIEFPGGRAAFAPVKDEFGNRLLDERRVDARSRHDFHGILAGAPVVVQRGGRADTETLCFALLLMPPLVDNMLAEAVFPGVAGLAPLAPVKDEILHLVQGKLARYVVVEAEQLQQVLAGNPV